MGLVMWCIWVQEDKLYKDVPMSEIGCRRKRPRRTWDQVMSSSLLLHCIFCVIISNESSFASGMASDFGTTYVYEQTSWIMMYVKSAHWMRLTDKHLEVILLVECNNSKADIDDILKAKHQFFKNFTNFLCCLVCEIWICSHSVWYNYLIVNLIFFDNLLVN